MFSLNCHNQQQTDVTMGMGNTFVLIGRRLMVSGPESACDLQTSLQPAPSRRLQVVGLQPPHL